MDEMTAKIKWCPFASSRTVMAETGDEKKFSYLPDSDGQLTTLCIGSECMVWRWQWVIEDHPVPMGVNAHEIDSDGNWLGYCGLACTP